MNEIFVLIEHRQGIIRDISYELLACGRKLAEAQNVKMTAVLFGDQLAGFIDRLKTQADRIIAAESGLFKNFNAGTYQPALAELVAREKPRLIIIGNTAAGMDIGPSLAVQLGFPCMTDCTDIEIRDGEVQVTRTVYEGKLNAKVSLRSSTTAVVTLRSGCFPAGTAAKTATVTPFAPAVEREPEYRRFAGYIEAAIGEIDITKADILVGIGRGVKEQANLPIIEEFARTVGGVVACSRPIVDAGWLPKDRQVGSSGRTVKPKLYLALGISGAFQHIVGMKNADLIIAVNKDPNAPIFSEADYGIVEDLFKVVPVLKNKILEAKQAKG